MYRKTIVSLILALLLLCGCTAKKGSLTTNLTPDSPAASLKPANPVSSSVPTSTETPGAENGYKLTIEDVKNSCEDFMVIQNIYPYKEHYVLVQYHIDGLAGRYEFINFKTGDRDFLPTGFDYASLINIESENKIIFYASGTNSETVDRVFPYIIICEREVEILGREDDFAEKWEPVYFSSDDALKVGSLRYTEITGIFCEKDSIEFTFGPATGKEGEFFVRTTTPPETELSLDKASASLIMVFKQTTLNREVKDKLGLIKNDYIASVSFKQKGTECTLYIKLTDKANEYTGECKHQSDDSDVPKIILKLR
jgi:hypothetical protein